MGKRNANKKIKSFHVTMETGSGVWRFYDMSCWFNTSIFRKSSERDSRPNCCQGDAVNKHKMVDSCLGWALGRADVCFTGPRLSVLTPLVSCDLIKHFARKVEVTLIDLRRLWRHKAWLTNFFKSYAIKLYIN